MKVFLRVDTYSFNPFRKFHWNLQVKTSLKFIEIWTSLKFHWNLQVKTSLKFIEIWTFHWSFIEICNFENPQICKSELAKNGIVPKTCWFILDKMGIRKNGTFASFNRSIRQKWDPTLSRNPCTLIHSQYCQNLRKHVVQVQPAFHFFERFTSKPGYRIVDCWTG